jgi:hypothetical protein
MSALNMFNKFSMDEVAGLEANYIFSKWLERMHTMFPDMSIDAYHDVMNENKELFSELKEKICWGDSFMIEKTNPTKFRNGGNYRLIDYPEIEVPLNEYYDTVVKIKGVDHVVTDYGFLTFNAYPVEELDSGDEC